MKGSDNCYIASATSNEEKLESNGKSIFNLSVHLPDVNALPFVSASLSCHFLARPVIKIAFVFTSELCYRVNDPIGDTWSINFLSLLLCFGLIDTCTRERREFPWRIDQLFTSAPEGLNTHFTLFVFLQSITPSDLGLLFWVLALNRETRRFIDHNMSTWTCNWEPN